MIEMDREAGVLALSAPAGISLRTPGRVAVNGTIVDIQDRRVTPAVDKGI